MYFAGGIGSRQLVRKRASTIPEMRLAATSYAKGKAIRMTDSCQTRIKVELSLIVMSCRVISCPPCNRLNRTIQLPLCSWKPPSLATVFGHRLVCLRHLQASEEAHMAHIRLVYLSVSGLGLDFKWQTTINIHGFCTQWHRDCSDCSCLFINVY